MPRRGWAAAKHPHVHLFPFKWVGLTQTRCLCSKHARDCSYGFHFVFATYLPGQAGRLAFLPACLATLITACSNRFLQSLYTLLAACCAISCYPEQGNRMQIYKYWACWLISPLLLLLVLLSVRIPFTFSLSLEYNMYLQISVSIACPFE